MPACARCGELNPSEARRCWSCGALLAWAAWGGEERRVVTVLFVDLVDFTGLAERLDPEELKRVQAPYFQRVRAELERYGGHPEKYIGDAVMALFGAPVAHGDDAQRAVLAAFGIRRAIEELNDATPDLDLRVRIGVNTGEAFVDLEASTATGEGMAAGDVVVVCFRLQQAASAGSILVGDATYRATQRTVDYDENEPVSVKGKEEPLRAWAAVAPREAAIPPRANLVGRDAELAHLRSLVLADESAGPRLATLVGSPGIGKSRLLWELRESLGDGAEPVVWLQGRCLAYGSGVSFSAFAEALKSRAGILESDAAETVERKLAATVASVIEDEATRIWTEAYVRPLVGLEGAERLSGDRRGEAFAAWRRLVESIAGERRLVLAFEDVHWADDGLLDFIEHLCRWSGDVPLVIVCTAQPELAERRPSWPGLVQLEPLSIDDTADLVDQLLGSTRLPPDLHRELLARAAGNPLYAEEFVRMLQEREGEEDLRLPETVQAIIAGRLDRLHPEAKEVLRDAAVVGTGFWVGPIAHVSGLGPDQVERRLGELQWKELVRPQPRTAIADESQYSFWHVLIRDVAYSQIPHAARAEKHQATAEWIESLAPGRADLTELLAHHYSRALEYARLAHQETDLLTEQARHALRAAGERALTVFAYPAAASFFRQAIELWPDDDEAPLLLFGLGQALFWSERTGDDELARAREALVAIGDLERAAFSEVLLSRLAQARGDREAFSARAHGAVELLRTASPSRARAEALSSLAAFYAVSGDFQQALETSSDALALADALGLDEIRADSLTFRGHARIVGGDVGGIDDLEEAVEIAQDVNWPGLVRSCANLATDLALLGSLEQAWTVYERGRAAAKRFGDARGLHWLAAERPYEHYWRGAWDDALATSDALLAEPDGGYVEHAAKSVRAWIRLARGDHAGALQDSEWALDFARHAQDAAALCQGLALRSRVLVEAGRLVEAGPVVDEVLAQAAAPGSLASFWIADLAEALLELGRPEALSEPLLGRRTPTRWLVAAHRLAEGAFGEAADEYAAIGALPEEAKTRLRSSAALAASGDRPAAQEQLERALAFYRDARAEAYARAAQSLVAAGA